MRFSALLNLDHLDYFILFLFLVSSQVMSSYATKGVRILLVGDGKNKKLFFLL